MKHIRLQIFKCLLPALIIVIATACGRKEYRNAEGMIWHTTYHITYDSDKEMTDSILATLQRVGASMNVFDPESLASRANREDSVAVDKDYERVYLASVDANKKSGGYFDPTLGPLITAWGFGKGHTATADTLRIDSLLQITGIAKTKIENGRLIKGDRRIEFNFSAIAKGYGCDCVAEMLAANGAGNYLVEIGGEIRCAGKSPSGGDWRVSIDKPDPTAAPGSSSQCVIAFSDMGMATSGNYRNYHSAGNEIYGHTISPFTGRPAQTDVLSATVLAPTAMEADALATAMMAMGSGKAKELAKSVSLPVMLILADMTTWETEEFGKLKVN